jgi:DnaJ-class molecular chaperone
VDCPECRGAGYFSRGAEYEACTHCGGRGSGLQFGDFTKGSGRVSCPDCKGSGKMTCPRCHGRQKFTCHVCDGTGHVPDPNG